MSALGLLAIIAVAVVVLIVVGLSSSRFIEDKDDEHSIEDDRSDSSK